MSQIPNHSEESLRQGLQGISFALAGLFRRYGGFSRWRHPHGTELKLRNLADWVQLRISQDICRRLMEAERDEDHAVGYVPISTDLDIQCAPAAFDADCIARADTHFAHLVGVDADNRDGLQAI